MKPVARRLLIVLLGLAVAGVLVYLSIGWTLQSPQREGPPAMVQDGEVPRLWLLVKREERRQIGGGRYGGARLQTRYHFDLHVHDAATAERLWSKRLLTLDARQGGHDARARLLGQDGGVVWIFLRDQPLALSAHDATVVAGAAEIEQRNPALRGLLSKEPGFHAFDQALVLTTADARRFVLRAPGFAATPYTPVSDDHFRDVTFRATQWNGGYRTNEFVVQQSRTEARWLGLYTAKEAADAGQDDWGSNLADPSRVLEESGVQRRAIHSARIGQTKAFSEGTHERLFDVTRMPGTPEFLQGGFMLAQGSKQPLALEDPAGLLVLHRTRADDRGRLALTRLDDNLVPVWRRALPVAEIENRWQFEDHLLLRSAVELTEPGTERWHEVLVAVELKTGQARGWNVTLERAMAPVGKDDAWALTGAAPALTR